MTPLYDRHGCNVTKKDRMRPETRRPPADEMTTPGQRDDDAGEDQGLPRGDRRTAAARCAQPARPAPAASAQTHLVEPGWAEPLHQPTDIGDGILELGPQPLGRAAASAAPVSAPSATTSSPSATPVSCGSRPSCRSMRSAPAFLLRVVTMRLRERRRVPGEQEVGGGTAVWLARSCSRARSPGAAHAVLAGDPRSGTRRAIWWIRGIWVTSTGGALRCV